MPFVLGMKAADLIESSGLHDTVLRPTWFTSSNEVEYEITMHGNKDSVIFMKSLETFIKEITGNPEPYVRQSQGINKPNS
ncbi:hypothetical protein SAMN05444008_10997 [Cnuella takakiae]|uniref:NAD(P)H-binding n=1 Tax=Cnuella takakiae TaxID=1302690 RepID=A0A1M5CJG5_9BACT|nr:hypothetical protein [Cnuella takakiae]OLY91845.1 hypothetical protein BUE76_07980 [Cnuella takakiae]SHF54747.1 hypothetical protein SAMN05444008_10997 [Cnuella takakiae]